MSRSRCAAQPGAAIDQVEAARTLHDHFQQLLRRRQVVLRPAIGIIAIDDRDRAQLARAMRHVVRRLPLKLLGIGRLGLLRLGVGGRCQQRQQDNGRNKLVHRRPPNRKSRHGRFMDEADQPML
jgi:hypothetical protein